MGSVKCTSPDELNVHQRKQMMKDLYSPWKRRQELFTFALSVTLIAIHTGYFITVNSSKFTDPTSLIWMAAAAIFGITCADFSSGFVHWAADTWFKIETPVLGKALIRPFREHHIDPTAMLKHDFVETNSDTFTLSIPFTAYSVYNFYYHIKGTDNYCWDIWVLSLCVFVAFTNEFHKLSHTRNRPAFIQFLQNCHVILPPSHHRIHHVRPHANYYCITTGWLDPVLEQLDFWRRLEMFVTYTTGALPRDDDKKWTKMDKDK